MKSSVLFGGILVALFCCAGFSSLLYFENTRLRDERQMYLQQQNQFKELIIAATEKPRSKENWDIFGLQDMEYFRTQGKVDGKVEALLLMNKTEKIDFTSEQIDKIIEIAEKSSVSDNEQFLSLLCRAAYHKGIAAGEEYAKEENAKEYENGYHAAIEDFTCPETGKIVITPKSKEPVKKP